MATVPGVDISQTSQLQLPQEQQGQEPTSSDPSRGKADDPQKTKLSPEDQRKCMALVRSYKDQWSQDRLILMQRIVENLEFFKGNQFISFGGGTAQFFDSANWIGWGNGDTHSEGADDDDLYQYCNNFYQMLAVGFVAALCTQVPKSVWMPEDAEQLADTTTAKAAQILIDVVEQKNREQSLLKGQLLYLFTTGSCFRHTRYVVSADRWGTRPEPILDATEMQILPARIHCFDCGADSAPGTMLSPSQCPQCGSVLSGDSFLPPENGTVTRQVGTQEVPNGMVAQNLYCGLEVDVDPTAGMIRETPILNLEVEVHVAALRSAYPDMYAEIQSSATSELSANGSIDRIARQQVFAQTDGQTSILSDRKPTLSRTWIQPWAFAIDEDKDFAERMRTAYPSGMLLVSTGSTFLGAQEADMTKEWTWAGTHEKFGMFPPAPGDVVVPFQKDYNDLATIMKDGIDRGFSGVLLANADLIGSKSLQGKRMLPGSLNLIKPKRTGAPGSMKMQDALYQFQVELKIREGMEYLKDKMMNAQTFAMVPPQVYGGANDPSTETFGGQQLQTNKAMGVLNIYWENLREEHAQADELAVNCAKDNMTDDLRRVIRDKGAEFRNEYVRLDDLQGSIHAYPDTDQGMPVTAPELRQRWMDLLQAAEKNPVVQMIFKDPSNAESAARALGVPGMVVPGEDQRSKTLQIIEELLKVKAGPIPQINPQTGQPTGVMLPTIMPDKDIDDWDDLKETVKHYLKKNFNLATDNAGGYKNCLAYLTQAVSMETAFNVQQAQNQGAALGAGKMAAAPPPKPPPQLSPAQQAVLTLARQDGAQGMGDLVGIAGTAPLPKGSSLQAQTTAAAKLVDIAMKAEQLNVDATSVQ